MSATASGAFLTEQSTACCNSCEQVAVGSATGRGATERNSKRCIPHRAVHCLLQQLRNKLRLAAQQAGAQQSATASGAFLTEQSTACCNSCEQVAVGSATGRGATERNSKRCIPHRAVHCLLQQLRNKLRLAAQQAGAQQSATASGAFLTEQSTACCNSCATSCGWQRNRQGRNRAQQQAVHSSSSSPLPAATVAQQVAGGSATAGAHTPS